MMKLFRLSAMGAAAALAVLAQPVLLPHAVAQPAAQPAHQRLLPLEGGRNFRDLGGYRAADGRTVKWGVLFRSGSMHELTANDYAYLEKLGIRTVCDFRSAQERKSEPVAWPHPGTPNVLADDYDMMQANLLPKGDMRNLTPEQARQIMAGTYSSMLTTFAGQYRRMFAELLAGHAPLAFNCSAGKDRTGVAAALILTALGVPRETVIEDYLLTNKYLDSAKMMAKQSQNPAFQMMAQVPPGVAQAMGAADRSYIETTLALVDKHPGGAAGFFRDEMKLSDADIAKLRGLYLE
jgi:protein-tyrosine phosphatase